MFNEEKYYLGKLCLLSHEHLDTGLCLRGNVSKDCKVCTELRNKNFKEYKSKYDKAYRTKNETRDRDKRKKYRKKNKTILAAKTRRWYRNNKERKHKADMAYRKANGVAIKKHSNEKSKVARDGLYDCYVKVLTRLQTGAKGDEITPEMIKLKREQLTIYRLIKEIKNGIAGTRNKRVKANEFSVNRRDNKA